MSNSIRHVSNALVISIVDDLMVFDAFSPRVRAAFNDAPVKLSASLKALLLEDDDLIVLIRKISSELILVNPIVGEFSISGG